MVIVCPLGVIVRARLRVSNVVRALVCVLFRLHLDVKHGKPSQQLCYVLVGFSEFLLVLRVLVLVGAQLLAAIQLNSFVLSD